MCCYQRIQVEIKKERQKLDHYILNGKCNYVIKLTLDSNITDY